MTSNEHPAVPVPRRLDVDAPNLLVVYAFPTRTVADDIAEYRAMPPATRSLIHRLVTAIIDSGEPVVIKC